MEYTDPMGNYTGFAVDPYEEERLRLEEEERRRKEERARLEAEKPLVQTVTINPDGTQDVTIKGPASGIQKAVGAMTPKVEPTMAAPGPMSPDDFARYNFGIAQAESGNRPNIGFHDRTKSTAFGPHGITQGAYQDARRVNPALPTDITQASQEQLAQAQTAFTQQNAKYLQSYGVPVNANTLSTAHLLGAKGLNDFMTKKDEQGRPYLSPAAQAANGGYDKLAAIANQRLGGAMAPASGAVTAPATPQVPTALPAAEQAAAPAPVAPYDMGEFAGVDQAIAEQARQPQTPYSETQYQANWESQVRERAANSFITNQDNPKSLEELIANPDTPEDIREAARKRNFQLFNQARITAEAQEKFTKAPPTQQAKLIASKNEEGNILRAWLYSIIGFQSGAQAEVAKMNLPGKYDKALDSMGKPVGMIQYSTNGKPLSGTKIDGTAMSDTELIEYAHGGAKKWQTSAEFFEDKAGNIYQTQHNEQGGVRTINTATGAVYTGKEKLARLRDQSRLAQMEQQQIYRRENYMTTFGNRIAGDTYKAQLAAVADARKTAMNRGEPDFTDEELAKLGISRPALSTYIDTGQVTGTSTRPQGGTAGGTAGSQAQGGTTGVQGVPAVRETVAEGEARKRREQAEIDIGKKYSEGVVTHIDKVIAPGAENGDVGSRAIKEQLKIFNDPAKSNALFGLYNKAQGNSASDKNWAIVRDLIGGRLDPKTAAREIDSAASWAQRNLNSDELSAFNEYAALNAPLVAATVHAIGGTQISDRDRAAAEKMQVDLATTPALAAFNTKAQQLFGFELSRYRSDWTAGKDFKTVPELQKAWSKEQSALIEQFGKVSEERNAFIKANSGGKPASVGLVREAYNKYPIPQYDPNLNGGEGGWRNLRKRELNSILKGNQ